MQSTDSKKTSILVGDRGIIVWSVQRNNPYLVSKRMNSQATQRRRNVMLRGWKCRKLSTPPNMGDDQNVFYRRIGDAFILFILDSGTHITVVPEEVVAKECYLRKQCLFEMLMGDFRRGEGQRCFSLFVTGRLLRKWQ